MLFVSVKSGNDGLIAAKIADGIEYRLDLFEKNDLNSLSFANPSIVTWKEGFSPVLRFDNASFIDSPTPYHAEKYIFSKHFDDTPDNLEGLFEEMLTTKAAIYKIATFAHTTLDALKLLLFTKKMTEEKRHSIIALAMGEKGAITRILAPLAGSFITFACLSNHLKTAPGQITAEELLTTYNYRALNQNTAPYGLIGSPICQSIGHQMHNKWFKEKGQNKVYVKMELEETELSAFFPLAIAFGFKGFSVTMPLKEKVIPHLDYLDPEAKEIGAVNTIHIKDNIKKGFNTDGKGALTAIEKHFLVRGKKIALMGTGGASKAIAFEAKKRGAAVTLTSRNSSKEPLLTADLVINCTPNPNPCLTSAINPAGWYMDIQIDHKEGSLFRQLQTEGVSVISGKEMFIEQAYLQQCIWEDG